MSPRRLLAPASLPLALALALPLSLSLSGCGAGEDAGYASEALDSVEGSSTESALAVPAFEGADPQATADQLAQGAAGRARSFYQPPSCVTASAIQNRVTWVLKDCTGPRGLVNVSGTVLGVITGFAGGPRNARITSTGLQVNGTIVDIDSQVDWMQSGAFRTVTVTTSSKGTGARGNAFTHSGSWSATWDDACLSLDGTWSTEAGLRKWSTTVAGWKRCEGMCPALGGVVTYSGGLSDVTVTVTTSGGPVANWSSSRGKSGRLDLYCN